MKWISSYISSHNEGNCELTATNESKDADNDRKKEPMLKPVHDKKCGKVNAISGVDFDNSIVKPKKLFLIEK